jgi:hypothetical protein
MYYAVNLYSDDVVVDVITIRGNRNFQLRLFVKVRVVTNSKPMVVILHVLVYNAIQCKLMFSVFT